MKSIWIFFTSLLTLNNLVYPGEIIKSLIVPSEFLNFFPSEFWYCFCHYTQSLVYSSVSSRSWQSMVTLTWNIRSNFLVVINWFLMFSLLIYGNQGTGCYLLNFFFDPNNFDEVFPCNYLGLQPWTKYLRKTLVFMWNSALWGNINFYFSAVFCQFQQNICFWGETGH